MPEVWQASQVHLPSTRDACMPLATRARSSRTRPTGQEPGYTMKYMGRNRLGKEGTCPGVLLGLNWYPCGIDGIVIRMYFLLWEFIFLSPGEEE